MIAVGLAALTGSHLAQPGSADPDEQLKLICCLKRRRGMAKSEFYEYWLHKHGPLAVEMIERLGGERYVQSHTSNRSLGLLLGGSRGQLRQAYDGVTEVWFPSRRALVKALATPEGIAASTRLARDELNFIDLPRSSYFLSREHVLLDQS